MTDLDYVAARSEEYAATIHRVAEQRHIGWTVEADAALHAALTVLYHALDRNTMAFHRFIIERVERVIDAALNEGQPHV